MSMKNLKLSGIIAALLLLSFMFINCQNPFVTDLFKEIRDTVEDDRIGPVPNIQVFVDGIEIADGGASDAFLNAVQDTPEDVVFTIKNNGTGDLSLREADTIVFSGADSTLFQVLTDPSSMVIPSGGESTFTVRFVLDAPGDKSAQIAIYSDDPDNNPFEFTVTNTALPEIQVLIDGNTRENGNPFQFPDILYDEYLDITVTINNLGNYELELTATPTATVTGDSFTLIGSPPEAIVVPGGNQNFTVRFDPVGPGPRTGSISIVNTDNDESEYQIILVGNGFLPMDDTVIAAGNAHTAALKSSGTVWTCGSNSDGQLGDGTFTTRTTPVQVTGLTDITAIAAGYQYTLALENDGTVWAWGDNGYGQLGDGTTINRKTPVQVTGLTDITAITAGGQHTIALKSDGTVWSWGYNHFGQLGDGTTTNSTIPVQVTGLIDVTAIAAKINHSVALITDKTVRTWGDNCYGQLGDGTSTTRTSPVQVTGLTEVMGITTGYGHTIALKNDGTVWAWGWNDVGQLGDGTTTTRNTPLQVTELTDISAIAAGSVHTVALKTDGTVWAWGSNLYGRLGDGTTTQSTTPVQSIGLIAISAIAAG